MKATGVTRKVDELGRIVLPIELRRNLGIEEKTELEIYVEGQSIVLRRADQGCAFCGSDRYLTQVKGISICPACIKEISKQKLDI
ncbi:AbrB family transcriptional regulator [Clostridia bacterium]|nr:AbrB family transcriptional regulator [Clostridia bacterium]